MYVRPVKFINCLTDVTLIIKLPIGVMTKCERCIVVQTINNSFNSFVTLLPKKEKKENSFGEIYLWCVWYLFIMAY